VEFPSNEAVPLKVEKVIGHSSTALIESVRCKRIRLARKCIRVNRRAKLEDLVKEVAYMQKLHHRHVVQLVGSYLQKTTFAILLYPVATGDLAKFLDEWGPHGTWFNSSRMSSPVVIAERDLSRFFLCLAHTVGYIHEQGIRHMDLKPSNILVHERRAIGQRPTRSIYL
jgi:serine/threonine protein kinase